MGERPSREAALEALRAELNRVEAAIAQLERREAQAKSQPVQERQLAQDAHEAQHVTEAQRERRGRQEGQPRGREREEERGQVLRDDHRGKESDDALAAEEPRSAGSLRSRARHVVTDDDYDSDGPSALPTPGSSAARTPTSKSSGSPKHLPATPKSVRSQRSTRSSASKASTVDELREVAEELTSEEVRSLLASALVQHAMARLGLCLTDLLPELQATRLALPMTVEVLGHLEKRRVEALIMVLRERERMISDIERTGVRPSTTDTVRRAARPDLEAMARDFELAREKRSRRVLEHLDRIRDEREAEVRRKEEELSRLAAEQAVIDQRVKRERERRRAETRERTEARARANAQAKALQDRLLSLRKEHWRERHDAGQQRVSRMSERRRAEQQAHLAEQQQLQYKHGQQQQQQHLLPQPETDASALTAEAHRLRVREEYRLIEERRSQEMREQLAAKARELELARESRQRGAENVKNHKKLDEVDRIIKLERLARQEEHQRLVAEARYSRKAEVAKIKDEVSATLQRARARLDKQDMLRRLRRQEALETSASSLPGPGAYSVASSLLGGVCYSLGTADPTARERRRIERLREEPGPGEYSADADRSLAAIQPGVSFTRGHVLSDLDWAIKRSQSVPGPGAYSTVIASDAPTASMGGLASEALKQARARIAASTPGPGAYHPERSS
jgi:hypothetical protein